MAGILESMFAGAAVGGGAAMEDVYRRRDQSEIESKLAEQKARADQDRQIALQNLRQQGAVELQKDQQGYTSGENAIRRTHESGEKAEDRKMTGRYYGIIESQNEASNARYDRQMTESERHNRSMEGIYSGRDAARADGKSQKMPDHVVMQLKDMESEQKSIDQEIRRIRGEAATKPEIAMNPEMKGGIEAQVKNLQSQRASIEMRKTRMYIDNGAIDPDAVVSSQAAEAESLDDINKFVKDQQSIGGQAWAGQIADALERAGIPQRVQRNAGTADSRAVQPASGTPLRSQESDAGIKGATGVINSRSDPLTDANWDERRKALVDRWNTQKPVDPITQVSPQDIAGMDRGEVERLLAKRKMLSGSQIAAANARLRQLR